MSDLIRLYIDIFALVTSLVVALALSVLTLRKSAAPLKALPVFFLFLGPSAILVHMSCHIIEISCTAFVNSLDGAFTYNFRFYSLLLMAAALLYFNHTLLYGLRVFIEESTLRPVMRAIIAIVLISAPTTAFTPKGALPTIACAITLTALPFAKKRKFVTAAARLKPKTKRKPRLLMRDI